MKYEYLLFIVIFLLFSFAEAKRVTRNQNLRDDAQYNVTQLIQEWGYYVEQHVVITSDGYVLEVQRIPHRRYNPPSYLRPVILAHGILDTSATWALNNPNESLAFILSEVGFDIWLVNFRGNKYSQKNVNIDVKNPKFWAWTWDQHAMIDLPAVIQFVIDYTKVSNVSVIAHSQGASAAIAAFSTLPQVASKVNLFVGMAPITYMQYETSALLRALVTYRADLALRLLGDGLFDPTPASLSRLLGTGCSLSPSLCNNIMTSFFGPDRHLNQTRMPAYANHWPDVTSIRNMIHWLQNAKSGKFAAYSGVEYDPSKIACPTAIFSGTADSLADVQDIEALITNMKKGKQLILSKSIDDFSHIDFVWAVEAAHQVYPTIIDLLKTHT